MTELREGNAAPEEAPVPTAIIDDCDITDVTPLLRDDDRPLFNDSWEAEAFAIGKMLVLDGTVSGREWYDTIGAEIREAQDRGDPDRGDTYYQHWMKALESVCIEKGLFDEDELAAEQKLWMKAVANTPHGVPIRLENAFEKPAAPQHHHHDHDGQAIDPEPVAVLSADQAEL